MGTFNHRIFPHPKEIFNWIPLDEPFIDEAFLEVFQDIEGVFFHEDSVSFNDRLAEWKEHMLNVSNEDQIGIFKLSTRMD